MLLDFKERVVNLEESIGDVKETVSGRTTELDSREEQLKEVVLESLDSNVEEMQRMFNSTEKKCYSTEFPRNTYEGRHTQLAAPPYY
ncbi:hypothetical protein J1N35_005149 [Gossypium stocksii]|uniref:Uncharacterized protein n=1 Tax=Gossypium stocksii TaxID=47602 RepID=A0A9D3WD93_9ROSI|nr:hypothetical protein J1N35_005149 [Gossypium stocksii]